MIELNDGDFVVLGGVKYKVNGSELLPIGRLVGPHGGEMTTLGDAAKRAKISPVSGVINIYLNGNTRVKQGCSIDVGFDVLGDVTDYHFHPDVPIEINIPQQAQQEPKPLRELDLKKGDVISVDFIFDRMCGGQFVVYPNSDFTLMSNAIDKLADGRIVRRASNDSKQ